jgi:hypothetical protein
VVALLLSACQAGDMSMPVEPASIGQSGAGAATASTATPPNPPTDVKAHLDGTTVELTWTRASGAHHGYRVVRKESQSAVRSGAWLMVGDSIPRTETRFRDTDLRPGFTYHYQVFSYRNRLVSRPSEEVRVTVSPGNVLPPPPPPPPPPPQTCHRSHICTMATAWSEDTQAERDFIGSHFDWIMGGNLSAFKQRNPNGVALPYVIAHTVMIPGRPGSDTYLATGYYADMQAWFAARPQCNLENAFLHRRGTSKTLANRLEKYIWTSHRWVIHPGDACAREYTADRLWRLARSWNGVFIDEHGDIERFVQGSLEYNSDDAYWQDDEVMMAVVRHRLGGLWVQINLAEYQGGRQLRSVTAAGSAHLEMLVNPQREMLPRWQWIDQMLAAGVVVQVISAWGDNHYEDGSVVGYTPGNSASRADRGKLFELASYYMTSPQDPTRTLFTFASFWQPYRFQWIGAINYNVGKPRQPRRVLVQGTDPSGQRVIVYAREFDNALVIVRPKADWNADKYGDDTRFQVNLPSGTWRPLDRHGNVGTPRTSIELRNGEGAIFRRG